MTYEELLRSHSNYDKYINEWNFFIRSYMGGRIYKEGNYLLKHPFESYENFERRKKSSYFYNYCAPIVDILVSHLYKKPVIRDFESLEKNILFNDFLKDVDNDGSDFTSFMRDVHRFASIYGRVSVIVDKPQTSAKSMADAKEKKIRPYLSIVTPENIIDWQYEELDTGENKLTLIKIKEPNGNIKIWTDTYWELYSLDAENEEAILIDSGEHNLNSIPIVNIFNKKSHIPMIGISDIQDISDINKNIYFLCSDAKEIIENTAFPMLAVPNDKSSLNGEEEVGPGNIIMFNGEESNAKPYWLEAPHSSLSEIREWIKQDIREIHRIAKMGGVKSLEDINQIKSGIALEIENQQLYAMLSEKAQNMESAEFKILNLWAKWQEDKFTGSINYAEDFSIKNVSKDLDNLIKASDLDIDSPTFRKEVQKKAVDVVMPKIDKEKRKVIIDEINK